MARPFRSRRLLILVLALAAIAAGPDPKPTVTAILSTDAPPYRQHLDRFQSRFPGRVKVEMLGRDEGGLARSLAADPPDLILALGGAATRFAEGLGPSRTVLLTMVYDPDQMGVREHPNLCGVTLKVAPEKNLAALEAIWPGPKPKIRVGVIHLLSADRGELDELKATLEGRGHSLVMEAVSSPDQLEPALAALLPQVDVLWLLMEPELISDEGQLDLVLARAMDRKVAVVGLSDSHVKLGALLSVSVDYYLEADHTVRLAQKLIAGADPRSVGIEPPENLIWSLNLKVAREIGWEIPAVNRKKFERVYP